VATQIPQLNTTAEHLADALDEAEFRKSQAFALADDRDRGLMKAKVHFVFIHVFFQMINILITETWFVVMHYDQTRKCVLSH
jgi:hypothetical protein